MERDHLYTLVCYRPNGIDSHRGCVMGRTNSDHEIASFRSEEETAGFWAAVKMRDFGRSLETSSWDVTLLIDGFDENSVPQDLWETYEEKFDGIPVMAEASFEQLKHAAAEAAREKMEAGDLAAEKVRLAEAARKDAAELAEFERLRLKFAPS